MPYRVRSTDVWFSAPGIQAAYQPISAPDSLAARQNVGNDLRMAGRHTAQPGVLPTHDPRTGWKFVAASSQYLLTGVMATATTSILVRFSGASASGMLFGCRGSDTPQSRFYIGGFGTVANNYNWGNAGSVAQSAAITAGVVGFAANQPYRNGSADGAPIAVAWGGNPVHAIPLACLVRTTGAYDLFISAAIQAVAISTLTLTPAHVAQYSRQMSYCHVNPDWSAWGRRRRYYYAPSAAAGIIWRGVGRNSSPVGGSIGIGRST